MTTKIHASGDALLPDLLENIHAFLADTAYDAQERVLDLLEKAGVECHSAKEKPERAACL